MAFCKEFSILYRIYSKKIKYVKIIEETMSQVINNYSINKWKFQYKTCETDKMFSQNNAVPTYIVFYNIGYHKGGLNAFQVN